MIMQYDILGLSEDEVKNTVIENLTKEGKKNISIVSIIPITLGSYEGFNITVLYEEDIIQIEDIKKIKDKIENIKEELIEIGKQRNKLDDKLSKIKDNCSHDIIVRTYNNNGTKESMSCEGYCLICNQYFMDSDYYKMDFNKEFKNIIDFDCSDIDDKEKVNEALSMFYEEKEQNPNEEDKLVINRVNNKIKMKYKKAN